MMSMAAGILAQVAVQIPVLGVFIVGLVLSLVNRERLGRAANFALAGFILLLLDLVVGTGLNVFIPYFYSTLDMTASQLGVFYAVIGFIRSVIAAVAYGLLVAAIFRQR